MGEQLYSWGSQIKVTAQFPGGFYVDSMLSPSRIQISMLSDGNIWLQSIIGNRINLTASDAGISATITVFR